MIKLFAVLAISLTTTLAHADSDHATRVQKEIDAITKKQDACQDAARSNQEMIACEFVAYEAADLVLNKEYKRMMSEYQAVNDEYNKEVALRLRNAQRAWIAYRDANCSLESTDMLFGSGERLIYAGCLSASTKARVIELIKMLN